MKTTVSVKYFVCYCLWELFLDSKLPQTYLNLTAFMLFAILRPFKLF